MNKNFLVLFLLMLFVSVAFSYTAPTFEGQPIIVESGSDFYGSDQGVVTIDLNLTAIETTFKDFFIRIKGLNDTSTTVKEISFNKTKIETISYPVSQVSKTKISQKLLNKTPLEITLNFDPQEIGIGREFNIELVDKDGFIIADLDPFLSGWSYRQEWEMATENLTASVTNDHVIPFYINSTNADFWTNVDSNANSLRFTDSANALYKFHFEDWNYETNIMLAWVGITETFNSDANITGYMYYGNAGASSYVDEVGTYPASYKAVYHMDDLSGNLTDSTDTYPGTAGNTPTYNQTGMLGKAIAFQRTDNDYFDIGITPDALNDDVAVVYWNNLSASASGGTNYNVWGVQVPAPDTRYKIHVGQNFNGQFQNFDAGVDNWNITDNTGGRTQGVWYSDMALSDSSNGGIWILNGGVVGTDATTGVTTDASNMFIGASNNVGSPHEAYYGTIDEFKIIEGSFTDADANLLYWAELNPLGFISFSAEEEAPVSITWNSFKIVDHFTKETLDLNVHTDTLINYDFNVTLANFSTTDINTFYQVNNTGDDQNCFLWIRGAENCGYEMESLLWTTVSNVGDTYYMRSESEDDHVFKSSAYNIDPNNSDTSDGNVSLNNPNNWAGVVLSHAKQNAVGDSNTFFNLSFKGAFTGVVNKNLIVYDCNNSSVINPATSVECVKTTIMPTKLPENDGYYAIYNISKDTNKILDVGLNVDGNHYIYYNCPSCSVANYWKLSYINENSNVDITRNLTSSTGFSNLVAYANTLDTHLHFQNLLHDTNFEYYHVVRDDTNIYTSPLQYDRLENVNFAPNINLFVNPVLNSLNYGGIDVNVIVSDPNSDNIVCDLNLNGVGVSYSLGTNIAIVNDYCNTVINSLIYPDGNYYISVLVKETGTSELYQTYEQQDGNFFIDNNAPVLTVVYPNGNEYFIDPLTITIDFNVYDAYSGVLIDLNYSSSNLQGTGTELLLSENIVTGVNVICAGIECSYVWDTSAVVDGNYYILILASDLLYSTFDASDSDFNIYSAGDVPPGAESDYTERYINPESTQRDDNRYYNPDSMFNLGEDEKQTSALMQINSYLFYFGVIIIVCLIIFGVVLWKKR